jgi:hypothetical protein
LTGASLRKGSKRHQEGSNQQQAKACGFHFHSHFSRPLEKLPIMTQARCSPHLTLTSA